MSYKCHTTFQSVIQVSHNMSQVSHIMPHYPLTLLLLADVLLFVLVTDTKEPRSPAPSTPANVAPIDPATAVATPPPVLADLENRCCGGCSKVKELGDPGGTGPPAKAGPAEGGAELVTAEPGVGVMPPP